MAQARLPALLPAYTTAAVAENTIPTPQGSFLLGCSALLKQKRFREGPRVTGQDQSWNLGLLERNFQHGPWAS